MTDTVDRERTSPPTRSVAPHPRSDAAPAGSRGAELSVVAPAVAVAAAELEGVAEHLGLVDQLLAETCADLDHLWTSQLAERAPVDILETDDLPTLLSSLITQGGKRFRPVLTFLGWLAANGRAREVGHVDVVRVSAALELLHVFALIHDDVMDESDSRRGRPTAHVLAAGRHRSADGHGDADRFGESVAILLGDLAHAEADHLAAELPPEMRKLWRVLVVELVCGQRRDLTGGAAGRRDLWHARQVARMKSGAYTVERPLELGAAAAQAADVVVASLRQYGREVGEAFALRDDLLGVCGDPTMTGKPAGDDLLSGKPTVVLALAEKRLRGGARDVLARAGSPELTADDVALLQQAFADFGVIRAVEQRITRHVERATTAIQGRTLDPVGVEQLTRMAHQIAWRDK
ncbi:geranylgeranyl diphosphate synthase type I [Friedmanniella endophytica]|uniref:Geranylgeranyl diphosphate synthase type I n=1 Tax=Microlunatus kandeliicorticis TaxID=1759536 RepID=A0A7W3ITH2_9ACTN|nr:polyprenyl synthetase family protein [Microlunatus kandeliicorticis]MBA8794875.1 geranylgeranyl diphosphate synthase type I [Microlunatus kandeliicorticis]